jgi:hypothetical protein
VLQKSTASGRVSILCKISGKRVGNEMNAAGAVCVEKGEASKRKHDEFFLCRGCFLFLAADKNERILDVFCLGAP